MGSKELHLAVYNLLELRCVQLLLGNIFWYFMKGRWEQRMIHRGGAFWVEPWKMGMLLTGMV